jgi:hypothetical protein
VWKEHVPGLMRSVRPHLMFPTERRLIKKINSGAVSEKLCVQCTKSFTVKEDAEG